MRFRLLPCLLRAIAIAIACLSIAHAQQEQPGLFESLGKMLQPKPDAPTAEAPSGARTLAVAGKERRVALVIGNSAYPGAGALKNPANDANDIAAKLKKLGFDVTVRTDMRHKDMLRSLTDFGDKVQSGTEALFFYAGHGMQVRGKNYLLPIDAEIRNEASASSEAVDVDQLLDKLSLARLSVVILDACRNNPFERRFRGSGQGLAQINAPTGTLIAYATAPGKVAADGDGRNGLYTSELLTAMDIPGIKIEDVFKRVRGNVVKKSNDAQTPWESSSLTGDFYFTFQGPTTVNVQQAPARARTPEEIEDSHWDGIKDDREITGFEEYLKQYPAGRYAGQARSRIAKLKAEARQPEKVPVVVAPTPAQVAASSTPDNPEAAMWNEVKASGAREYLDAYLKQYPKGKYVALAKIELKKLDERDKAQRAKELTEKQQEAERQRLEALRIEQAAWDGAKATGSAAAYTNYLDRYPKGRYAGLAQAALPKLQREEAEKELRAAAERKQDEERQKLAVEKERREAEERARQEAARVAEQQRKAREEGTRRPQWAESDNGEDIDWNDATHYCASKGSGWRLPTVAELQSNYQSGQSTPCGQSTCNVSSNSRLTGPWFWTNESNFSSDRWVVYLGSGTRYAHDVKNRDGRRALCVRSPALQPAPSSAMVPITQPSASNLRGVVTAYAVNPSNSSTLSAEQPMVIVSTIEVTHRNARIEEELTIFHDGKVITKARKEAPRKGGGFENRWTLDLPKGTPKGNYPVKTELFVDGVAVETRSFNIEVL